MKRVLALLLCIVMVVMVFPVSAMASYSKVSNRGVKRELPQEKVYNQHPFEARVESGTPYGRIFFMLKPQKGTGI